MTLEEAQAQIIELQEKNTELENEKETLSQQNKTLTEDIERVRTLNQKYFEKLSMQTLNPEKEKEDDEGEIVSCEEFAKTINL